MPTWLRSLALRAGRDRPIAVAVAVSVALVAVGLATIVIRNRSEDLAPGQARMAVEGQVEAARGGAAFARVDEELTLSRGDRVRVKSGRAVLEFSGGADVELRAGSEVTVGGGQGADVRLDRGDLLVQVAGTTSVVDGGSAQVTVREGASKLRRSASLVVGVYEGSALVAGPGRALTIDRYRQAAVVGQSRVPREPRPLAIEEGDEWDRRFLGAVLELDRRLAAFGRGFEALLPEEGSGTPALYRRLLPGLGGAPVTTALLAGRSAGENLIGLSLVALGEESFQEEFDAVFGFREEGARWGLVAADRDYDPEQVVNTVEAAIDRAPLPVAVPDAGDAAPAPGAPDGGSSDTTTPTTQGRGGDDGSTTTTTGGTGPTVPPGGTTTTTTGPTTTTTGACIPIGGGLCLPV